MKLLHSRSMNSFGQHVEFGEVKPNFLTAKLYNPYHNSVIDDGFVDIHFSEVRAEIGFRSKSKGIGV